MNVWSEFTPAPKPDLNVPLTTRSPALLVDPEVPAIPCLSPLVTLNVLQLLPVSLYGIVTVWPIDNFSLSAMIPVAPAAALIQISATSLVLIPVGVT